MTLPAEPAQGSTSWYPWATGVHNKVASRGVTFEEYGAKGDGVTDDTTAIQNAVNATATSADRYVVATPGKVYLVSSVTLPSGNDITLHLLGATIQTKTNGSYAFVQATARRRVRIIGGTFTGLGNGLSYNLAASDTQFFDVHVSGTSFVLGSGGTALSLVGVREAVIDSCYFETCTAIYLHQTVNPHILGCQFKNCVYAVWADGLSTGDSHDAGVMISNITAIGCGYGVNAVCWDHIKITGSMIDYCDHPISITNCSDALISDNYVSVRDMVSTSAPAINVISNNTLPQGGYSQHIKIQHNRVVNHATFAPTYGVFCSSPTHLSVRDNTIDFWSTNGVKIISGDSAPDGVYIVGNVISGINTPGPCISVPTNMTRSYISENVSSQAISGSGAGIQILNNNTA